jgi:hypothetical protein
LESIKSQPNHTGSTPATQVQIGARRRPGRWPAGGRSRRTGSQRSGGGASGWLLAPNPGAHQPSSSPLTSATTPGIPARCRRRLGRTEAAESWVGGSHHGHSRISDTGERWVGSGGQWQHRGWEEEAGSSAGARSTCRGGSPGKGGRGGRGLSPSGALPRR